MICIPTILHSFGRRYTATTGSNQEIPDQLWVEARQHVDLRPAFHLKHADGIAPAEGVAGRPILAQYISKTEGEAISLTPKIYRWRVEAHGGYHQRADHSSCSLDSRVPPDCRHGRTRAYRCFETLRSGHKQRKPVRHRWLISGYPCRIFARHCRLF